MDWIDEQYEKIRKKLHNLPLFPSGMCYFLGSVLIAAVLGTLTNRMCDRQIAMWMENSIVMTEFESNLWIFWQHWNACFYLGAAFLGAMFLFYKNRLRRPFQILEEGVAQIQKKNLEFSMEYDCIDEMGILCASFEKMRETLVKNYEEMWKMVEEQKQLNAAFAHDLRTPLTVLKGYAEFLARYLPEGKVSSDKVQDILTLMTKQLERLTAFSKTMKQVRSLDEYPVRRETMEIRQLYKEIKGIAEALDLGGEVCLSMERMKPGMEETQGMLDENIVLEVLDNLLSNAIRFADSSIAISIDIEEEEEKKYLLLYVEDDGKGFEKSELAKSIQPYCSQELEGEHFGIGLHICSMLCRLHGGTFSIANRLYQRGAIVSASFLLS